MQADLAANGRHVRDCDFIDVDLQAIARPGQRARTDRKMRRLAREARLAALGHGPAMTLAAVQCNVERTVVCRIGAPAPGVIGREHAADEGNDGDAILLAVTYRIDVPPTIAAGRDRLVEAKSVSTECAASRPESAAIGTPGPGWTLPPAR
jgi:hypothetical protein